MATIKDVAKAAEVSISTVSYALNDDPRIPEKTAQIIKTIANEIGYFPSAAARNLKKRNTKTILVAISDFGGPVYHALLDGIQHELSKSNYTMIVATGVSSENLLKERSSDGAIVTDMRILDSTLAKIAKNFRPIIVLDRNIEDPNIFNMTIDNFQAMSTLTKAILNEGYQKIAYVHGVAGSYDNIERHAGFLKTMKAANLPVFAEYQGSFTKDSGLKIISELLGSKAPLPEMFICANDEMAIGIMDGLLTAGYNIPDDFGVSGFDDIELATYYRPELSTIRIDHFLWGQEVAATVIALLQNKTVEIHQQHGTVIIRDSF
jgi:LacI family transcriptional regulator